MIERFDTPATRYDGPAARLRVTRELDVRVASTGSAARREAMGGLRRVQQRHGCRADRYPTERSARRRGSNRGGMARLDYDGSWFTTGGDVTWDNPLRFTDRPTPATIRRRRLVTGAEGAVDRSSAPASAIGLVALPARSRRLPGVDRPWLRGPAPAPHTINSAITPIPLVRATAEAEACVKSMAYRRTSRTMRDLG